MGSRLHVLLISTAVLMFGCASDPIGVRSAAGYRVTYVQIHDATAGADYEFRAHEELRRIVALLDRRFVSYRAPHNPGRSIDRPAVSIRIGTPTGFGEVRVDEESSLQAFACPFLLDAKAAGLVRTVPAPCTPPPEDCGSP